MTEALYQLRLNQPSGIYFIQLNTKDKQRQIKIIKK
ncbi:T9SS type A sorting domain-containing protein [Mesoflavibacter zeaxanthinifaciens]